MQIWPFKPLQEVIETLEWKTDIHRAYSSEKRIALRTFPRRVFNIDHMLSDQEYSAARAMLRNNSDFMVPNWPQATAVGVVSSGTSVGVAFDTAGVDLVAGGAALLWQSIDRFEQVLVDAVSAGGVTLSEVEGVYTDARLMPLHAAKCPEGLDVSRRGGGVNECTVSMVVIEPEAVTADTYPAYRGLPVLTACPVIGDAAFSESMAWQLETLDSQSGLVFHDRTRDIPDTIYQMRWHPFTRADAYALRQWLYSRMGQQKAFWMSTRGEDFALAAGIGSADTQLQVFTLPGLDDAGLVPPFDIEISTVTGNTYWRRVSATAEGAAVDGKATALLTLDAALGESLSIDQVKRVSVLRATRFNADRIELSHRAAQGVSVQVPCIETYP